LEAAPTDALRQRREQYFTFSQSRVHFLRQENGRAQCAQGLVGRSAFERIRGIRLPGYGLAAPVEKSAICFTGKLFGDRQQMAGSSGGRVNF
jgi:hypothetical protein